MDDWELVDEDKKAGEKLMKRKVPGGHLYLRTTERVAKIAGLDTKPGAEPKVYYVTETMTFVPGSEE
jgi:hypothetical protein